MKTKSRRKWLALFMALVMLISTVSVTAFAEKQTFNGASADSLNEGNAAVTAFQDNERPTIIASDPNATSTTSSEDSESLPPPSVVVATVSDSTKKKKTSVQSDSDAEPVQWDISRSKEATNLDENFESNVTLSLPAGDYKGDLDVVFVLDGSTSTDRYDLADNASNLLKKLVEFDNLNVKAGLVIFGGSKPILYANALQTLTREQLIKLTNEICDKTYGSMDGRSGSNLQAGVKKAQDFLDADKEVDSADKYLIILTDGGARMWVNENDEAMSQGFRQNNAKAVSWGQNQDFASRYIEAGDSSMPLRTFDEVCDAGSTDASFAKYAMTESESKLPNAWENAANWKTVCLNEDGEYYTSLEVSTYYAATSIIEASQNSHVIWVDYPYHDGIYAEYTNSFKSWLVDNGYITRYDGSDESNSEAIFNEVKDQLIYLLDAGSTVEDYMGYVEGDYNLDFINSADSLTLTVGDDS